MMWWKTTSSPPYLKPGLTRTRYTARIKPASILFTRHSRGTLAVLPVAIRGVTGYVATQVIEATTIEILPSGRPHVTGFSPAVT